MKLVNFSRIRSAAPIIELVQDALQRYFIQLQDVPFLVGRSLNTSITAGTPVVLYHALGRTPVGWWVTDINAASIVYRSAWDESSITLNASVNCTVSVWVY